MRVKNENPSEKPKARKRRLLIEEANGELVVYDLASHNAHRLNAAAAAIWKSCNGRRTVEDIASKVNAALSPQARRTLVVQALGDLQRKRLLDSDDFVGERMSRRELMKKLGIGAAAAAMLPMISSIVAPTPAAAASCRHAGEQCDLGPVPSHPCCAGNQFCVRGYCTTG